MSSSAASGEADVERERARNRPPEMPAAGKRAAADLSSSVAAASRPVARRPGRERSPLRPPSRGSVLNAWSRSIGSTSASYFQRRHRRRRVRDRQRLREKQQCRRAPRPWSRPTRRLRELGRERRVLARAAELAERGREGSAPRERPDAPCRNGRHLFGAARHAERGIAVAVVREQPCVEDQRPQARDRSRRGRRIPWSRTRRRSETACVPGTSRDRSISSSMRSGDGHLREVGIALATAPVRIERRVEEGQRFAETLSRQRDEAAKLRRTHGDDVGAGRLGQPRETLRFIVLAARPVRERARVRDLGADRAMHAARFALAQPSRPRIASPRSKSPERAIDEPTSIRAVHDSSAVGEPRQGRAPAARSFRRSASGDTTTAPESSVASTQAAAPARESRANPSRRERHPMKSPRDQRRPRLAERGGRRPRLPSRSPDCDMHRACDSSVKTPAGGIAAGTTASCPASASKEPEGRPNTSPSSRAREAGENPARSRHCQRGAAAVTVRKDWKAAAIGARSAESGYRRADAGSSRRVHPSPSRQGKDSDDDPHVRGALRRPHGALRRTRARANRARAASRAPSPRPARRDRARQHQRPPRRAGRRDQQDDVRRHQSRHRPARLHHRRRGARRRPRRRRSRAPGRSARRRASRSAAPARTKRSCCSTDARSPARRSARSTSARCRRRASNASKSSKAAARRCTAPARSAA